MSKKVATASFRQLFIPAMKQQFMKIQEYAEAIGLALVSKKNLIAFGPPGFAKSEGMEFALSLVESNPDQIFVQSCGEGMTEERLFGNVDLKAWEEQKIWKFDESRSFLVKRFAVFEEGLDMPDKAIESLRDTLTRKMLRNGAQQVPLQTESLFILTNAEPKKKATLGESMKALLERFPLQLRVAWDSHTAGDYMEMFNTVDSRATLQPGSLAQSLREAQALYEKVDTKRMRRILADLLERVGATADPASGRTARWAEQVIRASAAMRGSETADTIDLLSLRFLPCIGALDHLMKEIRDAIAREEADRIATQLFDERIRLQGVMDTAKDLQEVLKLAAALKAWDEQVQKLGLSEEMAKRLKEAADAAAKNKA